MTALATCILAGISFAAALPAGASGRHHHETSLHALRRATAKYHHLGATLASGRVDLHLCMDHMGEHFADPTTFSDGVLDPRNPEAMVYEHARHGRLELVAVEWVSDVPGTVMGIPLHFNPDVSLWVLHAWIWKHNPDGLFQDMNPRVGNCP